MADKKNPFVNVDFSKDMDLLDDLDEMVVVDDSDRSKLIRKLVRQEMLRRAGKLPEQLPLPISKSNNRKTSASTSVAA